MKPARILIAQTPDAVSTTQFSLTGYELITTSTLKSAQYQVLEDGIDIFIIGIHFDESRATELINFIRDDEKHVATPIIVVRLLATLREELLRSTMNALLRMRTIDLYLELAGDADPHEKIREAVDMLLPANKLLSRKL